MKNNKSRVAYDDLKLNGNTDRIYSPWAIIKFLDLESGRLFEVGAYSRLTSALIKINFHHFKRVLSLFCNKTINNNKT